ncbi:MAG: sensor histidine kinase [Velocimicrobium sp.]
MFNALKRKLIRTYTATTGVILTGVVILTLFVTAWRMEDMYKQTFYNNFNVISSKVQLDNTISNLWIASQEDKNHLVIAIEENATPLKQIGAKKNQIMKKKQVEKLRDFAKKDGVDPSIWPVSVEEIRSKVYQWKEASSFYYGQILIFATESGYRSVSLVEKFSDARKKRIEVVVAFLLIALFGIFLLYSVSVWFVKKSVKPLEENKKRQDEFVASASHELRSPLTVIKANLSFMKTQEEMSERCMDQINKECSRMTLLIEDMLLLASTESGSWKVEMNMVEVEHVMIETFETYLPLCKEKAIALVIDLEEEEMKNMKGDKNRVMQVLAILMDNAIRFSQKGSEITLRGKLLSHGKRKILLEVEDHGIGIFPERRELVFERFYQEDTSRSDKNHFGLGLSIARQLVMLQQGTIVCKETKGGGTTFSLAFLEMD